jgi:hypothetical protein
MAVPKLPDPPTQAEDPLQPAATPYAVPATSPVAGPGPAAPLETPLAETIPDAGSEPADDPAPVTLMRWTREVVLAGIVVVGLCMLEGWLYLRSYYSFFHIPTEGLDVAPQEILFQGAHSLLFPLIVAPVALFLRFYARRMLLMGVLVIAACAALLAWVASVFRWYSAMDIMVQTAAVLWIGLTMLAVQRGFGHDSPRQRLLLAGAALLVLVSMPTAFGTIDAGQQAGATKTHLLMVSTHELGLPDPIKAGPLVEYRKYVLLRETGNRYWLLRLGHATEVYSVAKGEVLYLRY